MSSPTGTIPPGNYYSSDSGGIVIALSSVVRQQNYSYELSQVTTIVVTWGYSSTVREAAHSYSYSCLTAEERNHYWNYTPR